jgi:glycyl-tRNA synthetase
MNTKMETIVSLCKRRGFIFAGSEIYGGLANSWDYGPLGVELKNNIKQMWWERFVHSRSDVFGIDAALIMNTKVWEASGHLEGFSDLLMECKHCHARFRADDLGVNLTHGKTGNLEWSYDPTKVKCKNCGKDGNFTPPRRFNLMLETFLGSVNPLSELTNLHFKLRIEEGLIAKGKGDANKLEEIKKSQDAVIEDLEKSTFYFRPETAQAMFVNFKNVLDTMRPRVPFGIAQTGKAFRNEITPGNFIFRTREFEQMEIEYFVRANEWEQWFGHWEGEMKGWIADLGIDMSHVQEVEIPEGERAHYSKRTVDFEYDYPFGRKELYGLAYRADFDLKNHQEASGVNLKYTDPETGEEFWPHVIEPTWGVDRSVLAVLLDAYREAGDEKQTRVFLQFPPRLAPYQIAVFSLLANKPPLVVKAKELYTTLQASKYNFRVAWDSRGNVGKRYFAQDEIGTPWCVTVDFQTLEDNTVTVRDRDTAEQIRKHIDELQDYFVELLNK